MKFRYTPIKNGKYDLSIPNVDNNSSSSKTYVADYGAIRAEISPDETETRAALVPLHLTFG